MTEVIENKEEKIKSNITCELCYNIQNVRLQDLELYSFFWLIEDNFQSLGMVLDNLVDKFGTNNTDVLLTTTVVLFKTNEKRMLSGTMFVIPVHVAITCSTFASNIEVSKV
jgi:hypothetical protein